MKLLLRWFFSAALLMLVAYYLPGVHIFSFYNALIAALVLGLINAIIRPIAVVLTLPVNVLTLGLFSLVINALMFWLAGSIVKGFYVDGFWPAFWGSIIMSLGGWLFSSLLKE
jgi:putative membrane protein